MRAAFVIGFLSLLGCSRESKMPDTPPLKQPAFSLTVEEVFYIKPPVDRVILVGTITEGSVKAGDSLTVKCKGGDVPVIVDALEHPSGPMEKAGKGQQVGLKLSGIRRDQATRGDQVVR
jgi:selenocysteine-specific translation elongation factor